MNLEKINKYNTMKNKSKCDFDANIGNTNVNYSELLEKEDNLNMDKTMYEYFEAEKKEQERISKLNYKSR